MPRLALLLAALLAGCAVGPNFQRPELALTPQFLAAAAIDTRTADASWWRGFNDPLLVALVDKAVAGNTDLAQARARIAQSRAVARSAGAALLPVARANGGVDTVSGSRETAIGHVTQALRLPRDYTEYSVGATASWEIDLFGGLRRGREAARADLAATEADAGAVAVAVAAETADAYLTLRALQARLAVAHNQEANELHLVELVRLRVDKGVAADRELNRSDGDLLGVRAVQAPLRAAIAAQLNRLDVLVGEQPGTNRALLVDTREIPHAPMPVGSAAPLDLLRRRPDVVAAERALAASSARIGVAVAEYYPHVSLSGLVGIASLGTASLFTGGAVQASGGAAVRWRLFDFGRVDAEVAQAKGAQAQALAAWRGKVLGAAEDVETALARLAEAHTERDLRQQQVTTLERARGQAQQAYDGGVVALIDVLDADRELLAASDRLATVDGDEARAAVGAYRALGGGWQSATVFAATGNK